MIKTLVLVRHAHREVTDRARDNGLSEKGREQARAVRRFFNDRFGDEDDADLWLVSSPKLRCLETLQPIAKEHRREIDVHPELDEAAPGEAAGAFDARVRLFLDEWIRSPAPLTLACSHGDWLPRAVHRLLGVASDHRKGAWFEVEWRQGRAQLTWAVPSLRTFYR